MHKILLYHIYPINHWKEITEMLFQKLPFDKIVVHVSLPNDELKLKNELQVFFSEYGITEILYSLNSGHGEADALKNFVLSKDLERYDILTYMHCKGVTKPENENILNWTKLMRYFVIEKMDLCEKAFKKGYVTYGINKSVPNKNDNGFLGSNFYYEGNFVSLNLKKVNIIDAVEKHLEDSYYGVEGFWGKLCEYDEGYTPFNSGINHYLMSVNEKNYTTFWGRSIYKLIKQFYIIKSQLRKASL